MGWYYQTCSKVGIPICEALVAASDGDFAKAVDFIQPVRYDIINIGGSGSQVCWCSCLTSGEMRDEWKWQGHGKVDEK